MKKRYKDITARMGILSAAALTGAMLLSGCGSTKDPAQVSGDEAAPPTVTLPPVETAPAAETTPAEATETTAEEETETATADTAAMDRAIPQIVIERSPAKDWYSDDGGTLLLEAVFSSVSVQNSGFDALSGALSALSASVAEDISSDDEMSLLSIAKSYSSPDTDYAFIPYSHEQSFSLGRVDAAVVSLRQYIYTYSGGAHGNHSITGYTFDVESGRELALEDILTDKEGFYSAATGYIVDALGEAHGDELFPDYAGTVEAKWTSGDSAAYYLDAKGIVIPFDPYSVGPYVMGSTQVTLPYKSFGAYMDPRYLPTQGKFAACVDQNEDIAPMLGFNGPVMIEVVTDDYEFEGITIISGTASDGSIDAERFIAACVLRTGPDNCLLAVTADLASDDYVTYLYRIGNDQLELIGDPMIGLRVTGRQVGPDGIEMQKRLDVLGSYTCDMIYSIGADGTLTPTEDIYSIDTTFDMTVIKDLPVTIDGQQATLPVGSTLKITGTDDDGTAYFKSGDGTEGTISYTSNEEEWELYIDGVPETEYFEMIPYAG